MWSPWHLNLILVHKPRILVEVRGKVKRIVNELVGTLKIWWKMLRGMKCTSDFRIEEAKFDSHWTKRKAQGQHRFSSQSCPHSYAVWHPQCRELTALTSVPRSTVLNRAQASCPPRPVFLLLHGVIQKKELRWFSVREIGQDVHFRNQSGKCLNLTS